MRAQFEKVVPGPDRSFKADERRVRRFDAPWHYHPEVELTWIVEGRGRRFVGDSIEPFAAGDLVLLGPNLPHFWQSAAHRPAAERAQAIVVQFTPNFLGGDVWARPEFRRLQRLLARAGRGLRFDGPGAVDVRRRLRALPGQTGLGALVALLDILDRLTRLRTVQPLASAAYAPRLVARADPRLARVYDFLTRRYAEPLTLPQIARVAAMTPAGFSRYFKRLSGRAVSDFINDLRIDHAARLLRETGDSVAAIAAESGFATLSNFNRRFRERVTLAPREYRREVAVGAEGPPRFTRT